MPARLFLIGKDTGGNSPPPTPGLGAYCFRVWGSGVSQWLLPGMGQGPVGCREFSFLLNKYLDILKLPFRHLQLISSLFCG